MTSIAKIQKPVKGRLWRISVAIPLMLILIALIYSISVLTFVYSNVWNSELTGGGNGPADAYRHSLASATIAHTLSPEVVYFITDIMEQKGVEAGNPENIMDKHNNYLGAKIGSSIPLTLNSIFVVNKEIRQRVNAGAINTKDPNQIRFMPKNSWVQRRFN